MNKIERKIFRGILEKKLSEDDAFSDSDDDEFKQEPPKNAISSTDRFLARRNNKTLIIRGEFPESKSPALTNNFMEKTDCEPNTRINYFSKFRQSENIEFKDLESKNSNDSQKFGSTERPKTMAGKPKEKQWLNNIDSNNDITSHENSLIIHEEVKCLETEGRLKDECSLYSEKID